MEKGLKKEIKEFLLHGKTRSLFSRPFCFCFLLSIYYAYLKKLKAKCGCNIKNVLVYKNKEGLYEFLVNFGTFTPCLVSKIKSGKDRLLKKAINQYLSQIKKIKRNQKNIFDFVSDVQATHALVFMVPYIEKDLGYFLNNKPLIEKCIKVRLKTEKFFMPQGKLDTLLEDLRYLPPQFKNYNPKLKEFIIYNEKIISDKQILKYFKKLKKEKFEKSVGKFKKIKGTPAYKGKKSGKVSVILSKKDFYKMKKGNILVASSTTPDYLPVISLASAIVSDEGGFLTHSGIIAREMKIPCIIGTKIATKVLRDGMMVEVDANRGVVRILKK